MTLAIGIILLLLITLITLYGGRTTILDQRISANDYRSREASGTAQAGLNYGTEFAKAHQDTMRINTANGWLDGTLDLVNDNPEWSDPVVIDCTAAHAAGTKEKVACDSGFNGVVRFFGAEDPDDAFDPTDLATYDVPLDWPASGSGALDDCPGADCRVAVEFALCEFDVSGGDCVAGGTTYAVLVLARGASADGTAQASVRHILTPFDLLPGNAIPPLMAASNINISGTLDVVVNPDGAGPGSGVPISGWANDDLVLTGAATFCYPDEYFAGGLMSESKQTGGADLTGLAACNPGLGNQPCVANVPTSSGVCPMPICDSCDCPAGLGALTRTEGNVYKEGIDVVDRDQDKGPTPDAVNFPEDVFEYVFGVPHENYEIIKDDAEPLADCSTINANSSGLYWVEGNCSISGVAGSPEGPVIIITEGDFRMQGGGTYFGLVFAFSDPPTIPGGVVRMAGGPEFYGTIISDHQIDMGNGNYDLIFSECMLQRIRDDDAFRRLGPVPGSWADHI